LASTFLFPASSTSLRTIDAEHINVLGQGRIARDPLVLVIRCDGEDERSFAMRSVVKSKTVG
jgi:hypothetical protein